MLRQTRWSRWASVTLAGLVIVANLTALGMLISALSSTSEGPGLLLAAMQVWLTNVIGFGLLYWEARPRRTGPPANRTTRPASPSRLAVLPRRKRRRGRRGRHRRQQEQRLDPHLHRLPLRIHHQLQRVQPHRHHAPVDSSQGPDEPRSHRSVTHLPPRDRESRQFPRRSRLITRKTPTCSAADAVSAHQVPYLPVPGHPGSRGSSSRAMKLEAAPTGSRWPASAPRTSCSRSLIRRASLESYPAPGPRRSEAASPTPAGCPARPRPGRRSDEPQRSTTTTDPAWVNGCGQAVSVSMVVRSTMASTTSPGTSRCRACCASSCCRTSTRAACHADQCPDTNAHNDRADT